MQRRNTRIFTAGVAAAALATTLAACVPAGNEASDSTAVECPTKLELIVAATAGSGADITARLVAEGLESELEGTSIQTINRPGAGIQIGVQAIVDARADGSIFGLISLPTAVTLTLDEERQVDFDRDSFAPLGNYAYDPGALAVTTDSPYETLEEFLDSGPRTIGVAGARGREHLDVVALQKESGADLTPVFHDDSGLALNSLLGGHIDAVEGSVGDFLTQIESGRVRILTVFDDEPSAFAPDVPTAASVGIEYTSGTSRGFAFPAGTPDECVSLLSDALGAVAEKPESKEAINDMGLELRYMNAEDYGKFWDDEVTRVTSLMEMTAN